MLGHKTTPHFKGTGKHNLPRVQEEENQSIWWAAQCAYYNLPSWTLNIPRTLLAMLKVPLLLHTRESTTNHQVQWWSLSDGQSFQYRAHLFLILIWKQTKQSDKLPSFLPHLAEWWIRDRMSTRSIFIWKEHSTFAGPPNRHAEGCLSKVVFLDLGPP